MTAEQLQVLYKAYVDSGYRVSTDTRTDISGSVFFCLKGENFDANTFAHQAKDRGASLIVIDNSEYENSKTLCVANTLDALQELAHWHRKQIAIPIIALTGSNGKTTTKELIYSVLKQKFRVVCTQGNLNNHIGVPLTILAMQPDTEIGVVEMGANHFGEIAHLCRIADPDMGYITSFGKAHLQGFGSLQGVIRAKSELYDYLKAKQGLIVFNADNFIQREKLELYERTYSFSSERKEAQLQVQLREINPMLSLVFGNQEVRTQLVGRYNFDNIMAAIAFGRYFGLTDYQICIGLESYVPNNNRSQLIKTSKNRILLDAYNANPDSMRVALANFEQMPYVNKIVILGDMRELGSESFSEHQLLVDWLSESTFEQVWLVGEYFTQTKNNFRVFSTTQELIAQIDFSQYEDFFFFIKGSRFMAMERIVPYIV